MTVKPISKVRTPLSGPDSRPYPPTPGASCNPAGPRPCALGMRHLFWALGRFPWPQVPVPTLGSTRCRGHWLQPVPQPLSVYNKTRAPQSSGFSPREDTRFWKQRLRALSWRGV